MTDAWDGRPQNPERDGWHWTTEPLFWSGDLKMWRIVGDMHWHGPKYVAFHYSRYLGPCATPAALAASQETVKELVAALRTAIRVAGEAQEKWDKDMRAGKLLIAMIDPTLRYRADISAMHAALARAESGQ